MKIVIVGATGVIGSAVSSLLERDHEVIRVARSGADIAADVTDEASIQSLYRSVGSFDALICTFGVGGMGDITAIDDEPFNLGWHTKVLPQIALVRLGIGRIADGGSFTLTSGVLSKEPAPGLTAVAATNGAIDAFCRAAAVEMPRGIRINCISPVYVIESLRASGVTDLSSYPTQSAADTAIAYAAVVTGTMNGQDIDPRVI